MKVCECPKCKYRISKFVIDQAKIDKGCPRCGTSFKKFKEIKHAKPTLQKGQ